MTVIASRARPLLPLLLMTAISPACAMLEDSQAQQPTKKQCLTAWNSTGNAANRAWVAASWRRGYLTSAASDASSTTEAWCELHLAKTKNRMLVFEVGLRRDGDPESAGDWDFFREVGTAERSNVRIGADGTLQRG